MVEETHPPKKGIQIGTLPGILIILTVIFVCAVIFGTNWQQERNLREAAKHIKVLNEVLSEYPEFDKVLTLRSFGRRGSIILAGEIAGEEDGELLVKIVSDTNPPVTVEYNLRLADTEEKFFKVVNYNDE